MKKGNDRSIDPAALPEDKAFERKEVNQHPQPADTGKPLKENELNPVPVGKQAKRSAKEEGINEVASPGNAGAFEGFEADENPPA